MDIKALSDELVRDEALRLKPYRDSKGLLTIGVGRNLDEVGITQQEAMHLLQNDIGRTIIDLDKFVPFWRRLDETRQRVLANMMFNMGWGKLGQFKMMLGAVERGDFAGAAAEMANSAWAKQVGPRAERLKKMMLEGTP